MAKQKYRYSKKNKKGSFKKIEETEGSNFGNYSESTGGGKPFSTSNTRTTRENGKYRQANNKTNQPRTDDGKFTYKSVNGKSIDPQYGPSRGKTVNPLLTGGENGIKIEDVEKQFENKQGDIWDKYKDKWYRKGSEKILGGRADYRTRIAGESIWEIARQRYDEVNKEFGGKIVWDSSAKMWVATDEGKESDTFKEVKKGRSSKEELAAKTQASKTGKEADVVDVKTGSIKLAPNAGSILSQAATHKPIFSSRMNANTPNQHRWVPKMATPTMTTAQWKAQNAPAPAPAAQPQAAPAPAPQAAPVVPGQSTVQKVAPKASAVSAPAPQPKQLKHSASDLADLRNALVSAGELTQAEMDAISDDILDANWDQLTN